MLPILGKILDAKLFGPLRVKWWYDMFSSIKMEEDMESELSELSSKTSHQKYSAWVHGEPIYAYEG